MCRWCTGLTSSAVVGGEVSALAHESRDDTMEARVAEAKPCLMCAQLPEILYQDHRWRATEMSEVSESHPHCEHTHLRSSEQCLRGAVEIEAPIRMQEQNIKK